MRSAIRATPCTSVATWGMERCRWSDGACEQKLHVRARGRFLRAGLLPLAPAAMLLSVVRSRRGFGARKHRSGRGLHHFTLKAHRTEGDVTSRAVRGVQRARAAARSARRCPSSSVRSNGSSSCSTDNAGARAGNSPPPSSSGSRLGTTRGAVTPRSTISALSSTNACTPRPWMRHRLLFLFPIFDHLLLISRMMTSPPERALFRQRGYDRQQGRSRCLGSAAGMPNFSTCQAGLCANRARHPHGSSRATDHSSAITAPTRRGLRTAIGPQPRSGLRGLAACSRSGATIPCAPRGSASTTLKVVAV